MQLVHPQLPASVCAALNIPPLESLVTEQLDPASNPRRIEAIQVLHAADACLFCYVRLCVKPSDCCCQSLTTKLQPAACICM